MISEVPERAGMTRLSYFIPIRVPSLNELIGMSPHAYNAVKKRIENQIGVIITRSGMPAFRFASIEYVFFEPNAKRDPSNIVSAGMKLIEDAMVRRCVLPGDGWASVLAFKATWQETDGIPGVGVTLEGELSDEPRERIYRRKLEEKAAKTVEREKSRSARGVGVKRNPRPAGKAAGGKAGGRAGVLARLRKG